MKIGTIEYLEEKKKLLKQNKENINNEISLYQTRITKLKEHIKAVDIEIVKIDKLFEEEKKED